MKSNPCRRCEKAFVWKNRHMPSFSKEDCKKCEKIKSHKKYLESKRKYIAGDLITSIDELLEQKEWVMWGDGIKHISVIKNLQLNTVIRFIGLGYFRKAIKKEV